MKSNFLSTTLLLLPMFLGLSLAGRISAREESNITIIVNPDPTVIPFFEPTQFEHVNESLIPDYNVTANKNPRNGGPGNYGSCDGLNGTEIPCQCPVNRFLFIGALRHFVRAGQVLNHTEVKVTFPDGDDKTSQVARMQALVDTQQSVFGIFGQGCPDASSVYVSLLEQAKALPDPSVTPFPAPTKRA